MLRHLAFACAGLSVIEAILLVSVGSTKPLHSKGHAPLAVGNSPSTLDNGDSIVFERIGMIR